MKSFTALILTISLFLVGCSSFDLKKVVGFSSAAVTAGIIYDNNEPVDIITRADLTEEETETVIESLVVIEETRTILKEFQNSPSKLIEEFELIISQYEKLSKAYIAIRGVVVDNFGEYSDVDQDIFIAFDDRIMVLDLEFRELHKNYTNSGALQSAMSIANIAIKTAALL